MKQDSGADGPHRPPTGAERLEEPVRLVGETKVGLAQLKQQLHERGRAREIAQRHNDAELRQVKIHLQRHVAPGQGVAWRGGSVAMVVQSIAVTIRTCLKHNNIVVGYHEVLPVPRPFCVTLCRSQHKSKSSSLKATEDSLMTGLYATDKYPSKHRCKCYRAK